MGVDFVSFNPLATFLTVVKPLLHVGEVVFGWTLSFELWVHDLLQPTWVVGLLGAVNTDEGVEGQFHFWWRRLLHCQHGFATGETDDIEEVVSCAEPLDILGGSVVSGDSFFELVPLTLTECERVHFELVSPDVSLPFFERTRIVVDTGLFATAEKSLIKYGYFLLWQRQVRISKNCVILYY